MTWPPPRETCEEKPETLRHPVGDEVWSYCGRWTRPQDLAPEGELPTCPFCLEGRALDAAERLAPEEVRAPTVLEYARLGIVTVDEARKAMGLPPLGDGTGSETLAERSERVRGG